MTCLETLQSGLNRISPFDQEMTTTGCLAITTILVMEQDVLKLRSVIRSTAHQLLGYALRRMIRVDEENQKNWKERNEFVKDDLFMKK